MALNRIWLEYSNSQDYINHLVEPTLWAYCSTLGNEQVKEIEIDGFSFIKGVEISVQFQYSHDYEHEPRSPLLKINQAESRAITYENGIAIAPTAIIANAIYHFIFNGTNFMISSVAAPQAVYTDLSVNSPAQTIRSGSAAAESIGVQGVLGIGNGGTGIANDQANRLVWSNNQYQLIASNHYADAEHIAINTTSSPSHTLTVNGTSYFHNDNNSIDAVIVGELSSSSVIALNKNSIQEYRTTSINNTITFNPSDLLLQPQGGGLTIGSNNHEVIGTCYGTYNFNTTNGFNYSGIYDNSNHDMTVQPIWFSSPKVNQNYNYGIPTIDKNFSFDPINQLITFTNGGGIQANNTLQLISTNNIDFCIKNTQNNNISTLGTLTSSGLTLTNLYINNLIPRTDNNGTLGSTTNKWANVYIGTKSTYGDIATPIYWNNGVPKEVDPIQKSNFTFTHDPNNVESDFTITSSYFNNKTILITAVVTEGAAYLQGPICGTYENGSFKLTTEPVTGTVKGYIITARGVEISSLGG